MKKLANSITKKMYLRLFYVAYISNILYVQRKVWSNTCFKKNLFVSVSWENPQSVIFMVVCFWYKKFEFILVPNMSRHDDFDALVQDCSNSITNAMELLYSCTKPWICCFS